VGHAVDAGNLSDILAAVSEPASGATDPFAAAPAISCRGLRKVYGGAEPVVALDGVDLDVPAGAFQAVLGPSGGGKSTLLHMLGGIDRPTSGDVIVGGRTLADMSERALTLYRRRDVGMVFQFFNLLPHLTVQENVELPRLLDGRSDAASRASELLDRVELAHRAGAYPYELSGGEMQRVAIARALVTGARLLLADEPTGNLDSRNGERVLSLLDEIRRERGVTLVLATHSEAAAGRADRRIEIRDGRTHGFAPAQA
jgi:ABC-type lipoprotein export system ATPase subunit